VLADVGHEDPVVERRDRRRHVHRPVAVLGQRDEIGRVAVLRELDEPHVAPSVAGQPSRVVVGPAAPELAAVGRQVVPLLARDLARLAPDAHRGVGEEAHALSVRPADRDLGHAPSVCSAR
jgi:hypothetical protein